jgi:hypothetical protein
MVQLGGILAIPQKLAHEVRDLPSLEKEEDIIKIMYKRKDDGINTFASCMLAHHSCFPFPCR